MRNRATKVFFIITLIGYCQILTAKAIVSPALQDTSYWQITPTAGLYFSQTAYSDYWKGGGINSVALGSELDLNAIYKKDKSHWQNRLLIKYGVIKLAERAFQKNEDHFEVDSKYGYKVSKQLKLTGLVNFRTFIHDFYEIKKSGEQGKKIGNFLAPAYLNFGTGMDFFTKNKILSVYYSPVNSKITYVNDKSLAQQYLAKEQNDKNIRYELGSLLRLELKTEILTNVFIHSIGTLFTNHLQDFGQVDVNIENKINFKVNKAISVNILTNLVYDDDILFDLKDQSTGEIVGNKGPRTQFKEVLNIGLSHTF